MRAKDFVTRLRAGIVDENVAIYRDLFSNASLAGASDPYWRRALVLFNSLTSQQKEVFLEVLRQVAVDTTANILGVLDGVNSIEGMDCGLLLICDTEADPLNGDLQNLFLEEEERATK